MSPNLKHLFGLWPRFHYFVLILCLLAAFSSCGPSAKLKDISGSGLNASLMLPGEAELRRYGWAGRSPEADSDGLFAMSVIRDEESGEVTAFENLDAAVIVARFRNTAERSGLIRFDFMIVASDSLQDPSWQLRFYPVLYFEEDSLCLSPVYLTGEDFRKAQIKAEQKYEDFLSSLSADSTRFVDRGQVDCFKARFPEASLELEELERHFRRPLLIKFNALKKSRQQEYREKLITTPLKDESVRRDSTWAETSKDFVYIYRQSIKSRASLNKFSLKLKSEIWDGKKVLYSFKATEPVTYYVSSLSSLTDETLCERHAKDSSYLKGVELLKARDWEKALELLADYGDYHSALAYLALEYNATASLMLEGLNPQNARTHYLLSIAYARREMEEKAVEQLKLAVELDPSYKYRGNLDPEIASIIQKYGLFQDYS